MKKLKSYLTLSFAVMLSLIVSIMFTAPVLAAVGTITTSPLSGPVGTTVSVSGTGFTAGSTYTVNFGSTPVATGTIATPSGNLTTTTFIVPTAVAGTHNISVTTTGVDTSNTRTFTITPQITLSSTSVTPGTTILVNGSGFGASRTVTIYIDSVARTTTTSNTVGTFSDSLQIPSGAGGTHTVTATDSVLNTASTTYSVIPTVSLSSGSVTVGSQLTVTGANFAASTSVRIYVGSTLITTVSSNTTGSFTANITVPQGTYGSHTVTATDLSGNSDDATFSIIPSISANTTTITSGSQITVSGNGFAASSTVRFYLDNSLINGGTVNTNTVGSFSQSLVIPVITGGNHTLEARDTSSNSASLSFAITQGITVNPQSGTAGSNIQVTGKGFIANKSISIKLDGAAITTAPSSPVTNAGGEFTASFTIPAIFGGLHSIDVTDGTFAFSSSLSVTSGADISVIRGDVGTSVTVTGTSFGSNAAILMTFDGESVATVNADRNGAFSATFNVPPASGGNHTIIVSDRTRNVSFNFFVKSTVVMTPTSGFVGTSITLTGSGFASQKSLAVKYDATTIPTTTQTDTKGGFTIVFNAPVSKGGNHSVVVTDGTNTITNTFSMDATSPPVPVLLSPINKNGGTTPELQWNAVNDQSGVTYTLQISRNINFNILVIEKKGLTAPVYQVTEGEKLESASKQEPYYWRVKAIDGASNESAFSSTQSFYVGFVLANWALYLIFGIAVVIAFFLGFFLRGINRTTARKAPAPPSES
jgi:hypothetical protein